MRKKQQLNEQEIIQQYARGMTITQLAKMYHTSFYNIQSIVKEHYTPRQGVDCTKLYNYIYEDYCSGIVNYKLLANKHNVSVQVVRKAMRLHGVWRRNSFKPDMGGDFKFCYPFPALQRPGFSANNKAIVDYNKILEPKDIYKG